MNSQFGYVICGPIPSQFIVNQPSSSSEGLCFLVQGSLETSLETAIEIFWKIENLSPSQEKVLSLEDKFVEENFVSHFKSVSH